MHDLTTARTKYTKLAFAFLGFEFNIFARDAAPASDAIKLRFGATPQISTPASASFFPPRSLLLISDPAELADLAPLYDAAEQIPAVNGETLSFNPSRTIAAWRTPPAQPAAQLSLYNALPIFVHTCLRDEGIFFIHASAAARDGSCVIFTGHNNSGKSSLAKTLLLDGWKLYSDDNLPLVAAGGIVHALPIRESFNAMRLSADEISSLRALGCTNSPIPDFLSPPEYPAEPARIAAAFYPEWSDSETGPAPLPRAAALRNIYASCKTPLTGGGIREFDSIAAALTAQAAHFSYKLKKNQWFSPAALLDAVNTALSG